MSTVALRDISMRRLTSPRLSGETGSTNLGVRTDTALAWYTDHAGGETSGMERWQKVVEEKRGEVV